VELEGGLLKINRGETRREIEIRGETGDKKYKESY